MCVFVCVCVCERERECVSACGETTGAGTYSKVMMEVVSEPSNVLFVRDS